MIEKIHELFKQEYPQLFSRLYGQFHDIELVEDALQDSFEKALQKWPETKPDSPPAWIYRVTRNRLLDLVKRGQRTELLFNPDFLADLSPQNSDFLDEQLRLMCLCCHPALSIKLQVLLTLKLVGGLTVQEIASALLMNKKTVAQSLTRSKAKIKLAGIPFAEVDESHLKERIASIQNVLYLLFNEGYFSNSDHSLYRTDLCREAIRLTELLLKIKSKNTESLSLLCLMLYQNSRDEARVDNRGQITLLEEQDRSLWNKEIIKRSNSLFFKLKERNLEQNGGTFLLQAAIAKEHANAETFSHTNWVKICLLYSELFELNRDPVIMLAWISAESYRSSPTYALELMESTKLEKHLKNYRWFYSIRGELRKKVDDFDGAKSDYEQSLSLIQNPGERHFLEDRLTSLL